jgi:hypothetical protein
LIISDLESKLDVNNEFSKVTIHNNSTYQSPKRNGRTSYDQDSNSSYFNINLNSPTSLESTEMDYLREIIYSYMMGTDPVTMAKVIVAVLKFPDNEKQKLIENEKTKNRKWFSALSAGSIN